MRTEITRWTCDFCMTYIDTQKYVNPKGWCWIKSNSLELKHACDVCAASQPNSVKLGYLK